MNLYQPLTINSAPEQSKPYLQQIQSGLGFLPNLFATFAHSPAVLEGYLAMDKAWEKSSFTAKERQYILLAVSVENKCQYCKAAHSVILKNMMKADANTVNQIRGHQSIGDQKLDALVLLTREIVGERGFASESAVKRFLDAGYKKEQVMEILVGVALKTISNYLDHISPATLDDAFKSEA